MSEYLKPQSPLYHKKEDAYFYPLTTVDQVIMEDGSRLNTVFKSTVRKTVILLANNWSADAPYTQTVTFSDVNFDDLKVDAHVAYTGNKESDLELSKGYSCVSYVKKDGNSITFSCLKDKPTIDMPVEIVGTSCDSIANVADTIYVDPVLQDKNVTPLTSSQSIIADEGYDGLGTVNVAAMPVATQATPSISINSNGLITASTTQTEGYVAAGTKSATKQLTTKAAATITPGTSNKTIAAGTYLTGTQTIAGDADLIASNIKKGANIFNVAGSYEGVELNFDVVKYASEEDLLIATPAENTIGIVTTTEITSWTFSAIQPTGSHGMVWIFTGDYSEVEFNALKNDCIQLFPIYAKQYVGSAWTDVVAMSYQGGRWIEWFDGVLYRAGDDGSMWVNGDLQYNSQYSGSTVGTATFNTDSMVLTTDSNLSTWIYYKQVDLTNYSTLQFEGSYPKNTNFPDIHGSLNILSSLGTYLPQCRVAYKNGSSSDWNIDVSTLKGVYYIVIAVWSSFSVTVNSLKLI